MFNFEGLEVSVETCTFAVESVQLNILITYAPRKSLERSDSALPVTGRKAEGVEERNPLYIWGGGVRS